METRYLVVLEETSTGFSAYAPDLPGCVAAAETEAATVELMNEAVRLYLEEAAIEAAAAQPAGTTVGAYWATPFSSASPPVAIT